MCKAADQLSPEQKVLFKKLANQLESDDRCSWLPAIDAIRQHAELMLVCQVPYDQPPPPIFPPSE